MKLYKVLIYGGREWRNRAAVDREIERLIREHGVTNLLIISGGAPGADTMAKIRGKRLNVHVAEIDALWDTRNKGAGPQRNAVMAALEPNEAICFHENIEESKGSADMMKRLSADYDMASKLVTK